MGSSASKDSGRWALGLQDSGEGDAFPVQGAQGSKCRQAHPSPAEGPFFFYSDVPFEDKDRWGRRDPRPRRPPRPTAATVCAVPQVIAGSPPFPPFFLRPCSWPRSPVSFAGFVCACRARAASLFCGARGVLPLSGEQREAALRRGDRRGRGKKTGRYLSRCSSEQEDRLRPRASSLTASFRRLRHTPLGLRSGGAAEGRRGGGAERTKGSVRYSCEGLRGLFRGGHLYMLHQARCGAYGGSTPPNDSGGAPRRPPACGRGKRSPLGVEARPPVFE